MSLEKLSRLPRKREIAALILLHQKGGLIEYGTAIDLLRSELCTTKRTARNIIKRLKRIGALEIVKEEGGFTVKTVDPSILLYRVAASYIDRRRKRCPMKKAVLAEE